MQIRLFWLPAQAKLHNGSLLFIKKVILLNTPHFLSAQLQYPDAIHNYATRFNNLVIP